jgi:hypothetical protein
MTPDTVPDGVPGRAHVHRGDRTLGHRLRRGRQPRTQR